MRKILFLIFSFSPIILVSAQKGSPIYNELEQRYWVVYQEASPPNLDCAYYLIFSKDRKYAGVATIYGYVIIPPTKYSYVKRSYGYWEVSSLDGFRGICDHLGTEIIPPTRYKNIDFYPSKNYYKVWLEDGFKGKEGICNIQGKEIIPPDTYDKIENESTFFRVWGHGKCGIIDYSGKIIISPDKYTRVEWDSFHGLFKVSNAINGIGIVNLQGEELISPKNKYTDIIIHSFKEKDSSIYYVVKKGNKTGLLNHEYKEIIHPFYDECDYEYSSVIRCYSYKQGSKLGLVDYTGRVILDLVDAFESEYEGIRAFRKGELWGYVDIATGKILYEPQFNTADGFRKGVAKVTKGEESFIISIKGETLSSLSVSDGKKSDIDENIPETGRKQDNTFAIILTCQNYNSFVVRNAKNDGATFKEYCQKTLGIPNSNILYFNDATLNNFKGVLTRIRDIADVYEGDAKIIFYYSGQGLTDKNGQTYLLPTDGEQNMIKNTGISLKLLFENLGALNVQSTIVMLDAGFNNKDRDGNVIADNGMTKTIIPPAYGNLVVLLATSGSETANVFKKKSHGLFTYFLCKYIRETNGNTKIKELSEYLINNVSKQSSINTKDVQTPQILLTNKNLKKESL